jgi:hypothetical protein
MLRHIGNISFWLVDQTPLALMVSKRETSGLMRQLGGDFDNPAWPNLIFEFGPTSRCFMVRFKLRLKRA